jgi:hypothetical protein
MVVYGKVKSFEDIKGRRGNQKLQVKEGHTIQWLKKKDHKKTRQAMIYKTLHRKQKIEQHWVHKRCG